MIDSKVELLIHSEQSVLNSVVGSLKKQLADNYQRLTVESSRARDLTSQIVASTKDDQAQQLASDEAVSHQLVSTFRKEVKKIDSLIDKPYFARIVLNEKTGQKVREIEYKLGITSNLECRIIDWRNAPIAKLFYQYQEGEEYFEIIQNQEKEGTVVLRNQVEIKKGELQSVTCKLGKFSLKDGKWVQLENQQKSGSKLKPIVQLITPDQFQLITEDCNRAVLIQGIAGSGKTSIALHRLAWLMHGNNSDLTAEQALVIVVSNSLQAYISSILTEIGAENVKIRTFEDWSRETLAKCLNQPVEQTLIKQAPPWVLRVKKSASLLAAFQEAAKTAATYEEALIRTFANEKAIIEKDTSKLIDTKALKEATVWSKECLALKQFDSADLSLALLFEIEKNPTNFKAKFGVQHLVADEIQDLSSSEILLLLNLVPDPSNLTLVGDTAQQLTSQSDFQGWSSLRELISSRKGELNFTTLNLSHRSTVEIMRVADGILGENRSLKGRAGKQPIWFRCQNENNGIKQIITWIKRVKEKFPDQNLGVICRNQDEAKFAYSMLEPSFGGVVNLLEKQDKEIRDGIQIAAIDAAKGLEFFAVLIWNPSDKTYPEDEASKKALYTASTRSSELLCFVTWGKFSKLLEKVPSRFFRVYKEEKEE